jgi:hypothetical protein
MIDTPHNRRKIVHYVLGMRRVINQLNTDDDPNTFAEDINEDIEAIKADWNITDKQLDSAKRYMENSKQPTGANTGEKES